MYDVLLFKLRLPAETESSGGAAEGRGLGTAITAVKRTGWKEVSLASFQSPVTIAVRAPVVMRWTYQVSQAPPFTGPRASIGLGRLSAKARKLRKGTRSFWERKRHLCLMLSLPQSICEDSFTSPQALATRTALERFQRFTCVAAGRLLKRSESGIYNPKTTREIDKLLQDASAMMPPQWCHPAAWTNSATHCASTTTSCTTAFSYIFTCRIFYGQDPRGSASTTR